ncbi:hypothetical protein FG428_004303 [Yersinia enterocolitica]|uniref:hypothetical protein n=1 Tax=Yersinia enterocolitica TaxID=630 RepID=UPI0028B738F4|nr:hypothetical protein [Yersinia enterocolitica]EKN3829590.1 hypothetical protein [Yersinia enterocolitica]EKN4828007.1 hypothetical protein [Yersinia enterocolitica]EKN6267498.1 hypothetical protein [Yersinia enterocolitica]ELI8047125.1 hypothetical protein [Yersinia enterocolitica]
MIFLKTDLGHEKLVSWDDITKRPNFIPKISKDGHVLSHIIGHYQFQDKIHCGLTDCNQPHNKGYIVVTEKGLETNIGNTCGRTIFGVEFDDHASDFDRFKENEQRKSDITSAKSKTTQWHHALEAMRNGSKNISWITNKLDEIINANHVGRSGAMEMRSLSRTQNSNVTVDMRIIDKKMKELQFTFNKHYRESGEALEQKHVGKINYLHVLQPANNLRIMYHSVREGIKQVDECNVNTAPSPMLSSIAQRANSLDAEIKHIQQVFLDARNFLSRKNLQVILRKLEDMDDVDEIERQAFRNFIYSL